MKVNRYFATVLKLQTGKSSLNVPPSEILLIALEVVSGQQAMSGGLGPTSRFHIGDPWWTESLNKVNRLYATVLKLVTTKSSLKVLPSQILLIALKVVSGQQAMTGGLGTTSRFHMGDL